MSCIQFILSDLLQAAAVAVEEAREGGPPRDDVSFPECSWLNETRPVLVLSAQPERGGESLRSACRDR